MMILCKTHGGQPAMQVSSDVVDSNGKMLADVELTRVDFEYEGMPTHWFYLSPAMARRWDLSEPTVLPLGDVFPRWVDEIPWAAVCVKCYDESRHRRKP